MCVYLQGAAQRLDRTSRDSARPLKMIRDEPVRVISLPRDRFGDLCAKERSRSFFELEIFSTPLSLSLSLSLFPWDRYSFDF